MQNVLATRFHRGETKGKANETTSRKNDELRFARFFFSLNGNN